jgi:hypothetical protein
MEVTFFPVFIHNRGLQGNSALRVFQGLIHYTSVNRGWRSTPSPSPQDPFPDLKGTDHYNQYGGDSIQQANPIRRPRK